jgi:hypothetical protein
LLGLVRGKCCDILRAERTVLNILSRASGVATQVSSRLLFVSNSSLVLGAKGFKSCPRDWVGWGDRGYKEDNPWIETN